MPVEFGAPRTEVTAPSFYLILFFFEERDAQALCRSFTRFFALCKVRCLSRRVLEDSLSGASVACVVGADLLPYAWFLG